MRAAAASVFEAKQNPARNRRMLTILVIVMILMIPVGGGVLWFLQSAPTSSIGVNSTLANYDLSTRSLSDTPPPAAPAQAALAAPPSAEPAALEPLPATAETAALVETVEQPLAAADSVAAPGAEESQADAPISANGELAVIPAGPAPVAPDAAGAPAAAVDAAPPGVLEISRSRGTRQVNPDLVAAYESLQGGDLGTASRLYQQVLDLLPNNRDALLGLAQIDQRQSNPVRARDLYARLLQLNPGDGLAQAGLLQTTQFSDPVELESALKRLIGQYPDVAQLTLALGNLYASQQRWSEAQGAYYNALLIASRSTGGPVNPDYAFNLAVSLEQLDEPGAALEYYRQAQALARQVTPSFDPDQLTSRLAHLEQAQP